MKPTPLTVASAKRRMMYCAPSPLITAACKLEGKINRRNDLEPSVREGGRWWGWENGRGGGEGRPRERVDEEAHPRVAQRG